MWSEAVSDRCRRGFSNGRSAWGRSAHARFVACGGVGGAKRWGMVSDVYFQWAFGGGGDAPPRSYQPSAISHHLREC